MLGQRQSRHSNRHTLPALRAQKCSSSGRLGPPAMYDLRCPAVEIHVCDLRVKRGVCLHESALSLLFHDFPDAGVSASYEAEDAKADDRQVLPQDPVEFAEAIVTLPHGYQLDYRGEHQTQGGQADCADQRDEWAQVGNCNCNAHCEDHQYYSYRVFSHAFLGAEAVLHVLPDDLHRNVELETVGEENGNCNHYFDHLRWHLFVRKVEGDRGSSELAVLEVAKETNGSVQGHHEKHANVQDTWTTDKVVWSLHVVLQRHHLKVK